MPSTSTILLVLGSALALAVVAFLALRWVAIRISRRVAEATEQAIAVGAQRTLAQAGLSALSGADDATRRRAVAQIDRVARVMDRAVPLPGIGGIGLDPILGLVPVAGDVFSLGVSSVIIFRAAQLGVPEPILSRMIAIKCTDLVLGAVPIFGDLVDVAYKGNMRCVALVREHLDKTGASVPPAGAGAA